MFGGTGNVEIKKVGKVSIICEQCQSIYLHMRFIPARNRLSNSKATVSGKLRMELSRGCDPDSGLSSPKQTGITSNHSSNIRNL